jgi:tripartite-type tricarboxylate transporter receptor subunit TctC
LPLSWPRWARLPPLLGAAPARAAFPEKEKPIRIVVAFAPGSSTDIVARAIAEQMQASIGQTVVVENRPGAGGNIATQAVMNAPADGYTLLFTSVAYSVNPSLYPNAGYNALADLQGVAMAAVTPTCCTCTPT